MESSKPIELSREVEEAAESLSYRIADLTPSIRITKDNIKDLARAIIAQVREENWPISGRFIDTADQ